MTHPDHPDRTESLLRDVLADRAGATEVVGTPLARVEQGAARIRRRRRVAAGLAAVVAVLAVAVPVGLTRGDDAGRAVDPASTSASNGVGLGYAVDGAYHPAEGAPMRLPHHDTVVSVAQVGDRLLVSDAPRAGVLRLTELIPTGPRDTRAPVTSCTAGAPVLGADGTAAWAEADCDGALTGSTVLHTLAVDGSTSTQRIDGDLGLISLMGGRAYWTERDVRSPTPFSTRLDGSGRMPVEELRYLTDVDPEQGRFAAAITTEPLESGVLDAEGAVLWSRPGVGLAGFSPSGRYVLGGGSASTAVFVAATGRRVARLEDSGAGDESHLESLEWTDDEHLVGTVRDGDTVRFVGYGLDGRQQPLPEAPTLTPDSDVVLETTP